MKEYKLVIKSKEVDVAYEPEGNWKEEVRVGFKADEREFSSRIWDMVRRVFDYVGRA